MADPKPEAPKLTHIATLVEGRTHFCGSKQFLRDVPLACTAEEAAMLAEEFIPLTVIQGDVISRLDKKTFKIVENSGSPVPAPSAPERVRERE